MKIYFAGGPASSQEKLKDWGIKNKLYSFYNERKQALSWGKGLMLDSGAYSVFTQGITIDINELIMFIKQIKPEVAVQLDVIGNDRQTWKNYLYMKKQVNVIPVIHYQASREHIEQVFNSSDYVLLGGLVPLARRKSKLVAWLDYIFANFAKSKKVHLLGITTETILKRYPVYSSDSSSWLSLNRYPSEDPMNKLFQRKKDYNYLENKLITETLELEKKITKLWESRGVKWN